MRRSALAFALLLASGGITAQAQHQPASSPYAGFEKRAVAALSEQQIADLRAGRGMGLALPAEVNGYPGPSHVLELAGQLTLSDAQRARMQDLFAAMKAETIPIGERLIAQEIELDRQFRERSVTLASLTAATAAIGQTQGALRAAHLRYHLTTLEVLTPAQVQHYATVRGYQGQAGTHGGHHHRP